ncbi:type IV secretory system conjugative DNA transfer family protein [Aliamphritea ceti]|uniref:type IV secretory system conjugative DNA transfer family protein n=1 Tax=Aliamphritea ceti TaxID=1524258 RepID=UPI0021C3078B|nr:type IV secretory system conjugative DNA transfer family protein [Aliamphritea ceti]
MARNPNGSLPNRNTLYLGRSGAGKSQALKQNADIPRQGARVVLYDPNEDHRAHRYSTKAAFGHAVLRALRSGKGFRIAYTGGSGEADHEWFCQFVFSILDGKHLTYVIDEELGGSSQRSGSAAFHHGVLLNQGRKFGMRYHGVIQFAQEVPKTVYRNCEVIYVGRLDLAAAKLLSQEIGVPADQIASQQKLQFWVNDSGEGFEARQIQLKYKKAA